MGGKEISESAEKDRHKRRVIVGVCGRSKAELSTQIFANYRN